MGDILGRWEVAVKEWYAVNAADGKVTGTSEKMVVKRYSRVLVLDYTEVGCLTMRRIGRVVCM